MNQHFHNLLDLVQQSQTLNSEEKNAFLNSLKSVGKELEIMAFKLDRTEKVKRTTAILLEETIEELEQKRKAVEAQNRELEIEASLERVRARSLAMHHTSELQEVVNIAAQQLLSIGMDINGGVFICINAETESELSIWASGGMADYVQKVVVPVLKKPIFTTLRDAIKKRNSFLIESFTDKEKQELFTHLFNHEPWRSLPPERKQELMSRKGGFARSVVISNFSSISITNHYGKAFTNEENEILKRFGNVFEQSFIRFLDLQKAETQAREAKIESALERVRSRTMGMQKSEELKDVIQIVYDQLVQLKIPLEHTGFILDYKNRDDYNSWIADHLGSPSSITIPYFDALYYNRFNEAKKNEIDFFAVNLTRKEKNKFYRDLFKHLPGFPQASKEFIFNKPALTISTVLLEHVALYMENFSGNPYTDEENAVLMRFGNVFQQTYTRFLDLQKAETQARQAAQDLIAIKEAKHKAEEALTELKSTQSQLIHAEKMASLGELTAGIAHEIQNPLNFVNNFSEVNTELIEELKEELTVDGQRSAVGGQQPVMEILEDIRQNMQKISHHGKRADAIVKGMLQHSRSSSNSKEPTDINALADQYLRLSYHGLRAKDKSFNSDFTLEQDPSLPMVNVVPQDIGRVFLNLFNNAFYAVSNRNLSASSDLTGSEYKPTVTVTTKNLAGKVEIRVKDNGDGIPAGLLDKIFQPFFTTKPTGEGTGLGLSLSYDIIKAHGGELKVETREGKGTEFIICLNTNVNT